ncbi:MAG TPA: T9SS type A sorting domain-containing protein [Ignavibacteriaceae bacterium]|nr:T9SS type A sorting domain-containing protein [Ignavibacteriaceae bacterium]
MRMMIVNFFYVPFFLSLLLLSPAYAQWNQPDGPDAGGINRLASKGSIIFAGTNSAIYSSADSGSTWINTSNGLPTTYIQDIFALSDTIFVSAYEGIFLSTDGGTTWEEKNNGINTSNVNAVRQIDTCLFAATINGVYRSNDFGNSWTRIDSGFSTPYVDCMTTLGAYLFAGTDAGVYMSPNLGNTWQFANSGISGDIITSMTTLGRSQVFASTYEGVFVSTDQGSNWTSISNGLNPPSVHALKVFSDKMFAGVGKNGADFSTDQGANWYPCDTSLANPYIFDFLELDGNVFAASGNGIYKSTDNGDTWVREAKGIHSTDAKSFLNLDPLIIVGTYECGAFSSPDSGKTWHPYTNMNLARGVIRFAEGSALFAATNANGLLRSRDGGVTWQQVLTSVSDLYYFTVAAHGNTVLAASYSSGAFRSTDDGTTWTSIGSSLIDPDIDNFTFIDSTIYAATTYTGFIFRSTDDGITWVQSSNGLTNHSSVHRVIKAGNYFFASANDGIYRSTDGLNWNLVNNGMTTTTTLTVDSYDTTIFTGTNEGFVYKSTDYGENWTSISDDLPPEGYTSGVQTFDVSGNNLLAGTFSTGVFWRPLGEVVTSLKDNEQYSPESFSLAQNYPNPFNPTTSIEYSIPREGFVSLTVYNVLGQKVATLVDKEMKPGNHHVTFDASGFASGIYFYRLKSSNNILVKKMVILK